MTTKRIKAPETDETLARDITSLTPLNDGLYTLSDQLGSFIIMLSNAKSKKGLIRTARQMLPITRAMKDLGVLISKLNTEIVAKLTEEKSIEPPQEKKEEQLKH